MSRPPADEQRIRDLGVTLESARLVAFTITKARGWKPAPGSPRDIEGMDSTATPLGSTWGNGLTHPEDMARFWFEVGGQHLYTGGIQMQHDPMLMTAPWPTVRAAVEHFATLAWVIAATDSTGTPISAQGRVARATLVELSDQRYLKNEVITATSSGPPMNPTAAAALAAQADYETYRDGVANLFSTFDRTASTIDGLKLPSLSNRLGDFASSHLTVNGWHSYNLLSQNTHPTRSALLALRKLVAGGGFQLEAPLDHFEGLAFIGLACQFAALRELFRWYGWPWDHSTVGALEQCINTALPGAVAI